MVKHDAYVAKILGLACESPTGREHGLNRTDALKRADEEYVTEFLPALEAGDLLGAVLESADEAYYVALAWYTGLVDAATMHRRLEARAAALDLSVGDVYCATIAKYTVRYHVAFDKYDALERAVVGLLLGRIEWNAVAGDVQDVTRRIMDDLNAEGGVDSETKSPYIGRLP